MRTKQLLGALSCGALLLTACTSLSGTGNQISIGIIGPMSGGAAAYGQEGQAVFEYALQEINETAALQGYEFELVYEDGICEGPAATTALQKLNDFDNVDFVVGGVCSSESLAIAPLLEENGMMAVSWGSSSPELDGVSPYFFSFSYSDDGNAKEVARQLSQYGSVAMLTEQHEYSTAFRDVVSANISTEVLLDLEYPGGETDMRNELEQIKASGAEAVFFNPGPGSTVTSMARQIVELGEWDAFKITQFVFSNEEVLALDTELLNGIILVDAPRADSESFNAVKEAITADGTTLANIGDYYTASAYDTLTILADLIMQEQGNVEAVREALSTGSFDGLLGNGLSFGGNTFVQGIGTASFVIQNGELIAQ